MTQAQKTAANPKQSVWVAASAGTGKTKVLTDRVLRLLLGGVRPGKILCLTFTKAAAAEMSNRINKELGKWATASLENLKESINSLTSKIPDEKTLNLARNLFLEVLDAPDGIKIQTIHSFCQTLMSRFPLEANIPPHFQVIEERTALEILTEARMRLLIAPESHSIEVKDALKQIAWMMNDSTFTDLLQEVMQHRQRIEKLLQNNRIEGIIDDIYSTLGVNKNDNVDSVLTKNFSEKLFNAAKMREVAKAFLESKGKTDNQKGQKILNLVEKAEGVDYQLYAEYKSAFLTQKDEPLSTLANAGAIKNMPDIMDYMAREQTRIIDLDDKIKSLNIAKYSVSLLHIAEAILFLYKSKKSSQAFLDYGDLIIKTEELLSQPDIAPWILYKLDSGIDHILVDEAQDTSPEQWRIIEALCEEFFASKGEDGKQRTIFVVGDKKQSIFSFQGANPATFNKIHEAFKKKTNDANMFWESVNLELSFRSTSPILSLVDELFSDENLRKSVALSSDLIKHEAYRKNHAGRVEIWPLIKGEKQEVEPWELPNQRVASNNPEKQMADKIANTIKDWLDNGRILKSKGRKITAGDIIVLVRGRKNFVGYLINALKKHEVPIAGADRMQITNHIAVMDLVAMGQFILLPEDDLNLATLLKSPLIGFDDADLYDIAKDRKGNLIDALKKKCDLCNKFKEAYEYLTYLLNKTSFRSPFEIYSHILNAKDGRKKFISRLGDEVNDPIDEFLALTFEYEKSHPQSLQGFISWVSSGDTEVKRDMEQGVDEVRIMTVHGSKGLQAPIIFMPDTTTIADASKDKILWTDNGKMPLMLWPAGADNYNKLCKNTKEINKEKAYDEYLRLLYVALTRAEDELYICGHTNDKKPKKNCWYDLISSVMQKIGHAEGDVLVSKSEQDEEIAQENYKENIIQKYELPKFALNDAPEEPTPPRPLTPSRIDEDEPEVQSPILEKNAMRGRIIHKLLQYLPDIETEYRISSAQNFINNYHNYTNKKESEEIFKTIVRVMNEKKIVALFEHNSKAEVPITGMINNYVVSGQVDRLVEYDDKILIIDYKTNRKPPKDSANISPVYIKQMAAYRNVLKTIYPNKKIVCSIIWTQTPEIMIVDEYKMELIKF